MMDSVAQTASALLIGVGAFFYLVGAIGIYRMPDVFTRMHAAGISDTVGAGLMVAGMMIAAGFSLVSVKLAIILGVILFTSPVATHALAQAALHANVKPMLTPVASSRARARKASTRRTKPTMPARSSKRRAASRRTARTSPARRRSAARKGRVR
ncbi:MAG: monovalent cation/H(+) antiporter subunit G [Pseudomonadota bacterium]|nr:monovalent cation/H(+) antiporter subunit G [Pseudomonadota bacterium]